MHSFKMLSVLSLTNDIDDLDLDVVEVSIEWTHQEEGTCQEGAECGHP